MSEQYYTISDARVAEIHAADESLTHDQIIDVATADWNESDEHQEWINTAPAAEIADWVATILEQGRE